MSKVYVITYFNKTTNKAGLVMIKETWGAEIHFSVDKKEAKIKLAQLQAAYPCVLYKLVKMVKNETT